MREDAGKIWQENRTDVDLFLHYNPPTCRIAENVGLRSKLEGNGVGLSILGIKQDDIGMQ